MKNSAHMTARKAKVILVVEDEPGNMRLLREVLSASGYATLEATDGKRGVEMARQFTPDLILMDQDLPLLGGPGATKLLKHDEATRDIPVVALTGYDYPGIEEEMKITGAVRHITKPITLSTFLDTIRQCLEEVHGTERP